MPPLLQQIQMPLLEEAVECWRPVEAEKISAELFVVTGTIPEGEVWAFQPGETVYCRDQVFEDGSRGLVAYARVLRDA